MLQQNGSALQIVVAHGLHPGTSFGPVAQTLCVQGGGGQLPQSPGQVEHVSPLLHEPSPQNGHGGLPHSPHVGAPQSPAHEHLFSPL